MSKIEKFEDLIAWQKARELTKSIYKFSREGMFAKDYGLSNQIQRAAVSVMANIAEGFERKRRGEFHQFLSVAKASRAELRSHLYVAWDIGFLSADEFKRLTARSEELAKIIGGLRSAVAKQKDEDSAK
jgi:four helix bundle protein